MGLLRVQASAGLLEIDRVEFESDESADAALDGREGRVADAKKWVKHHQSVSASVKLDAHLWQLFWKAGGNARRGFRQSGDRAGRPTEHELRAEDHVLDTKLM